ncbi:MAG: hypothetical protein J6W40_02080 [Alphaproteobacteria bacterium]|nr:hypothetical protein [Alphaproteobacteria bacterium]
MTDKERKIADEARNLILNYPLRLIHCATDYRIVTIGRLQIENLDWYLQPEMSRQVTTYLQWDPYDAMSPKPFNLNAGKFKPSKYGLSYREKPLTVATQNPLWKIGTPRKDQDRIMMEEMNRMKKEGARTCKDGLEITPTSPLWKTVDLLSTNALNTFRKSIIENIKSLEKDGTKYNDEELWDAGVPVTFSLVKIINDLYMQLTR